MADIEEPSRKWEDILQKRIDGNTVSADSIPPAGGVRLSELAPPRSARPQKDCSARESAERPDILQARLRESEEARQRALQRIAELEEEIKNLRAKLKEAYDIIKAIEDAYIAGQQQGTSSRP